MYIHQKNSKERFVFIPIPENEIIKKKPPKIEGKFHVVENSEYLIRMDNYPTLCSLSRTSEISSQYFLLQQLFQRKKLLGTYP